MKSISVFNKFPQGIKAILAAAQEYQEKAADTLRVWIVKALEAGGAIGSDTHALAESLYVRATNRNDYDIARQDALDAFKNNPSAYRNHPIDDKAEANFNHLLAAQSELPEARPHVIIAAVATMVSYGTWWETKGDRPWMLPGAMEAIPHIHQLYEQMKNDIRI